MINRNYKCIFIEVPKTGSTSIRGILGKPLKPHLDILEIKDHICVNYPYDDKNYNLKNWFYTHFRNQSHRSSIGKEIFNSYFKFGFVRNPWSRTVSLYLRNQGVQMKDQMSFGEFVDWVQLSSDTCKHPTPKKNQLDWLTDKQGNVLVDYIGRFENLEEDWKYISSKLKINKPLPHLNKNPLTENKDYRSFYTPETAEIIHQKFIKDIEYFRYNFDPN